MACVIQSHLERKIMPCAVSHNSHCSFWSNVIFQDLSRGNIMEREKYVR